MRTWKQRSQVISAQTQILWHRQSPEDHSHSSKIKWCICFNSHPCIFMKPKKEVRNLLCRRGNRMLGLLVLPRTGGLQEDFCNLTVCAHWLSQLQWLDVFKLQNRKLHIPKVCFSDFFSIWDLLYCVTVYFSELKQYVVLDPSTSICQKNKIRTILNILAACTFHQRQLLFHFLAFQRVSF